MQHNLQALRSRIVAAAASAGRTAESVTLLAVSKGQSAARIRAAAQLGLTAFGENYVAEALPKIQALRDLHLTWHFIGRLQANKTRAVAESFDWVHGIDRLRIAQRLAEQRPAQAAPLNVCVQIRMSGDPGRNGVPAAEAAALATALLALPRLQLRGLMCMLPALDDLGQQRALFREVRELRDAIGRNGGMHPSLDTLSMGMSGDFEAAILEGATLVRIGTALFGPRPPAGAAPVDCDR